jgi:hypothetical protein
MWLLHGLKLTVNDVQPGDRNASFFMSHAPKNFVTHATRIAPTLASPGVYR